VGDDDQSIYRFRGASISNILKFKEDYSKAEQIVLNTNYRSTQEILDASYKLIQHNNPDRLEVKNNINKRLVSDKKGDKPLLLHCQSLSSEADIVAQTINKLKLKHGYQNKDFAILVRSNNQADAFIQSLNLYKIPYIFSGSGGLLQKPEIKMAISFLRILANPEDNLSFFHLANSEAYGQSANSLIRYFAKANYRNRQISEIQDEEGYDSEVRPIMEDLEKYRLLIPTHKAGEILYQFLSDHKLLKGWINSKSVADEIKVFNMAAFFERIANFDHVSEDKSVLAFLSALELIIETGDDQSINEIDSDIDAVNILTAHAAKGLEYQVVFVVNMVSDRFPSKNIKDAIPIPSELIKERLPEGDFHTQEERRLFYVAITRAKKYLFITSGDDYGGKRIKKISPFVLEMFDEPNPGKIKHKLSPEQKIERFKKVSESDKAPNLTNKQSKILRLSRQQIDDYYSCPQKYYLAHTVKIPLLENHYLVYGTAIHAALNLYFSKKLRGEKATIEDVLEIYKKSFVGSGFISREHEDQRYNQGIETLIKFINYAETDNRIPHAVESSFEFNCGEVKVNGRYDLIYQSNKEFEICDFKTSEVKSQKDADSRIKKSTQMQIYALSWFKQRGSIPKTTLFFIEPSLKAEYTFSPNDLTKTEEMILEVKNGISAGEFSAKPNSRECGYCAYKDICPESLG
jgi:DNA helicase-2/ATP-dependent DNA helicase PcrA